MKHIVTFLIVLCLFASMCACANTDLMPDITEHTMEKSIIPETTVQETTVPESVNQYEALYTYLNSNQNFIDGSVIGIKTKSDNYRGKGDIYMLCDTETHKYCFMFYMSEQGIDSITSLYFSETDEDARITITISANKIDMNMILDIPKSEIYDFGNTKKSSGILYSYVTKESGYGADGTTVTSTVATHLDIMREEIVEHFEKNNVDINLVDLGFENIFVDKS